MSVTATEGLLIAGERTAAAEGRSFDVTNPATGQHLASVAEAGVRDVERAVAAAVAAYETWGAMSPVTRGRVMHRFAAVVEEHAEELALLECHNVGMPISDARGQLAMIVDVIRYYAGAVDKFFGHTVPVERQGVAMTFRSIQAAPIMQTPVFLILFFAPVYVPLDLLRGWIHVVATANPVTRLLEACRSLLAGDPTEVGIAFGVAFGLIALFSLWALRGLRRAEAIG